jgi:NTP pyrophosphatase (non-canonical NTP hydrolase)
MFEHPIDAEVRAARRAAHAKHGENSIEALYGDDPRWLSILVEEVGEVAHEQTYDADHGDLAPDQALRAELIDVLSVAHAWVDAIDRDAADRRARGLRGV